MWKRKMKEKSILSRSKSGMVIYPSVKRLQDLLMLPKATIISNRTISELLLKNFWLISNKLSIS